MSALPHEPRETEVTRAALDAVYSWNYEPEIDAVRTLCANALERQWIAVRDLDWDLGADKEAFSRTFSLAGIPIDRTRFWKNLDPELRWEISRRTAAFMLSNFLHGEQGALANFGEERAKRFDLSRQLPDDLDAWLEGA